MPAAAAAGRPVAAAERPAAAAGPPGGAAASGGIAAAGGGTAAGGEAGTAGEGAATAGVQGRVPAGPAQAFRAGRPGGRVFLGRLRLDDLARGGRRRRVGLRCGRHRRVVASGRLGRRRTPGAQHDSLAGDQSLDQAGPAQHADRGAAVIGVGDRPGGEHDRAGRPGQQLVDREGGGPAGQAQQVGVRRRTPGPGSSETLTSPCRNTAMPSSVAAMVPNPGTALVVITHSVSDRARSRPGAGAPSTGRPAGSMPAGRADDACPAPSSRRMTTTMPGTRATRCARAAPRPRMSSKLTFTRTGLPGIASARRRSAPGRWPPARPPATW